MFQPSSGQRIGDYELIHELGSGGMGSVWEAVQVSLGRKVALKLLAPHISISATTLQRFQREAEAGARLTHSNIVSVYQVGQAEGAHFIAQELVEGGATLSDEIAQQRSSGIIPANNYAIIASRFVQIAQALQVAHDQGVVHRDIKPANILLSKDGEPKVADFGLAQVEDALELSRLGEFAGTPFYMSPEQAMTKRIGIDRRTDVFSLGVTLWETLTAHRPFEGDTSIQVLRKIILDEPADPRTIRRDCPRDLAVICLKAMEKRPEDRFQSMRDFADDLNRYRNHEPIHAKPPTVFHRLRKWVRRHPTLSVLAAAFLLALPPLAFIIQQKKEVAEISRVLETIKQAGIEGWDATHPQAARLIRDWHETLSLGKAHPQTMEAAVEWLFPILPKVKKGTSPLSLANIVTLEISAARYLSSVPYLVSHGEPTWVVDGKEMKPSAPSFLTYLGLLAPVNASGQIKISSRVSTPREFTKLKPGIYNVVLKIPFAFTCDLKSYSEQGRLSAEKEALAALANGADIPPMFMVFNERIPPEIAAWSGVRVIGPFEIWIK
jgi:serine/threonine protein kinase